ncbi:hypothetical protein [Rubrolithibacter danxiaensis]|uniref:hypothetical protein n=1 Tax=Rubrolithibacter danxiaensis TaxID=3390805 RepID=UPI003BF8F6AA
MAFKFSDRVITNDGKTGIVQEDQEEGSKDVKILIEGDDFAHIYKEDDLKKDPHQVD